MDWAPQWIWSGDARPSDTYSRGKVLTRLQRIAALVKRLRQASHSLSMCIRTSRALVVGLLALFQNNMSRNMKIVLITFETWTVFRDGIFFILLHATFHRAWVKLPPCRVSMKGCRWHRGWQVFRSANRMTEGNSQFHDALLGPNDSKDSKASMAFCKGKKTGEP